VLEFPASPTGPLDTKVYRAEKQRQTALGRGPIQPGGVHVNGLNTTLCSYSDKVRAEGAHIAMGEGQQSLTRQMSTAKSPVSC